MAIQLQPMRCHNFFYSEPTKLMLRDLILLKILKWFNLGLRLKIDEHNLKKIRIDNPGDTDACSCEMFSQWLAQSEDASLEQLIEALCDVNEFQAARQLCAKFGELN